MTGLGINPFTNSLVVPVRELEFKNQYKKDRDGDLIPVLKEVEDVVFCRLYVTAEKRNLISNLSPNSTKLLVYIMYKIDVNTDYVRINKEDCMSELEIVLNTYKKSIQELMRYCFISPTVEKNTYWINPDFFFKGDRIKMYPNNINIR